MNWPKIEEIRKIKKISQRELATKADMSLSGYTSLIGNSDAKISTIENIAKALDVSPAIFWKDDQQNIVADPGTEYKKTCSECERMKGVIRRQEDHIELLMEECRSKKKVIHG
jgi:transcriptional regulator with XRE-family HTH domain